MEKLRIALALGYYEGGGFTSVVNGLAKALLKKGHDVQIVARTVRLRPPEYLKDLVKEVSPSRLSRMAASVDIVHIHESFPYTRRLVSDERHNIVFAWHGFPPLRYVPSLRDRLFDFLILNLYGRYLRKIKVITAISQYCSSQLKDLYGLDADVIYNGVDLDLFKPCKSNERDSSSGYPVIMTTGGYNVLKGSDLLPKLYHAVKKRFPRSTFMAHAYSSIAGFNDVRTFGFIPYEDLPKLYCKAHVFLLPSKWESFSMPLLESMATGTPVLALDPKVTIGRDDGRSEQIKKSGGGLLFTDENDLVEKLNEILERWDEFSKRALAYASRLSWDLIADLYIKEYMRVLS